MRFNLRFLFVFISLLISSLSLLSKVDTIHISTQNPKCFGGTDGYVTIDSLSTSTPSGPYNIRINTTPVQYPKVGDTVKLGNGNYTIAVFDLGDGNIRAFKPFTISEPFQLLSTTLYTSPSCYGYCDGSASAYAFDGTPPYTYQWSDPMSQTTSTASNLCGQKYYVTITDDNGCTAIDSVDITEPAQIIPNVTTADVACFGNSSGSATANPSGGTGTYTNYAWSSSSNNTATENNLSPGNYTVTVTDSDGCSGTENFSISQPAAPLSTNLSKVDVTCFGGNTGSINNNPSGGTAPYSYLWNDAASSKDRNNLSQGKYIVTITDKNACELIDSITINEPTQINSSITTTDVLCNGDSSGSATVSASGGNPGYTYQWSNAVSGTTNSNLKAGKYYVTITDASSCTRIDSAIIGEPAALQASINASSDPSCDGQSDGSIDVAVSGGTSPYSYLWDDAATSQDRTGLSAGTYRLTVTDNHGCIDTISIKLDDPAKLIATIDSTKDASCNGQNNGFASAMGSGGTSPYTYAWSNTITTRENKNLTAGTYHVTITDFNGCTATTNVTIAEPSAVIASATASDVSCAGLSDGSAMASGSGGTKPYSYLWSNTATTAGVSNLTAGDYYVTITDKNGCWDEDTVTVNQPTALNISITANNLNCHNDSSGSATATVSGGKSPYSFAWSDLNSQTTATATGLHATKYYVTVTDNNGCASLDSVTLNEPSPLAANISSATNPSCNGGNDGTATVNASGGTSPYSYAWNDPGNQSAATASNLTAGTYIVTVTDYNNCIDTAQVRLNDPAAIAISLDSLKQVDCFGGNDGLINLSISGGNSPYSYLWSDAVNTKNRNNLSAGSYIITVTDSKGCTVKDTFIIKAPAQALTANATNITDVLCYGDSSGSMILNVSGGTNPYSYNWSDGATSKNRNNLKAGNYTVTVSDRNACTTTANVTINEPSQLNLTIVNTSNASCSNSSDGAAQVSASGGTGPYSFTWSNGGSGTTQNNLSTGKYYVTLTDFNNCQQLDSFNINSPAPIVITKDSIKNISCNGGNDGYIAVSATGGNPSYTYAWSNAATGNSINNLTAGAYIVTVTDANNCTEIDTITLTAPAPLSIAFNKTNQQCDGVNDGKLNAIPSGGTAPYSYSWSTSDTTKTIDSLAPGNYALTITDQNSCIGTASVTINAATQILMNHAQTNVSCNGQADGVMSVFATGGAGNFSYKWSDSIAGSLRSNVAAGTYYVTATDDNACIAVDTVIITEPDTLKAHLNTIPVSCNALNDGRAFVTPIGGTSPYSYNWSVPGGSDTISNLSPGTYSVTVSDAKGCDTVQSFTIKKETAQFSFVDTLVHNDCFGDCDGKIEVNLLSGGTAPFTYQWSANAGSVGSVSAVNNLCSGTYGLTISDANGCDTIVSYSITSPSPLSASKNTKNESCSPGNDGTAKVMVSGGTAPYSYNWSNSQTTDSIGGLTAGNYQLTITDSLGCTLLDTIKIDSSNSSSFTFIDSLDHNDCFGDCNGKIEIYALSGGQAPYTYQWSNGAGNTSSIANLCAGSYSLTITDASGCDSTMNFNINEPSKLKLSLSQLDESCVGNDGSIVATASGGTAPYTYQWSNAQTTDSIGGLTAGIYTLTVTDSLGCSILDTAVIKKTNISNFTFTDSLEHNACFGDCNGKIEIYALSGGQAPYTYQWSNGAGNTSSISSLCAGSYALTITDANGCDSIMNYTITEASQLISNASQIDESCARNDGSAFVKPSGGTPPYSYNWSNNQNTDSLYGLSAGTYKVTISDSEGCDIIDTIIINTKPTILPNESLKNVSCFGGCDGSVQFNPSGAPTSNYTYNWTPIPPGGQGLSSASNLCAGTYKVTISSNGACDTVVNINITAPSKLSATIKTEDQSCGHATANCDGKAFVTTSGGTAPYTYSWSAGTVIGSNQDTVTQVCAGNYQVSITDAKGCMIVENFSINKPSPMTASFNVVKSSCNKNDGALDVVTNGGAPPYSYQWYDQSLSPISGSDSIIKNRAAGLYYVDITDANGCTRRFSSNIIDKNGELITLNAKDASCHGSCDGEATVSFNCTDPSCSIAWYDAFTAAPLGINSTTATNLCAGKYYVEVTNNSGCITSESITINEPSKYTITENIENSKCAMACDGKIDLTVSGASGGPYTYNWSPAPANGQGTANVSGLCAGTYSVTVSNSASCDTVLQYNITAPSPLTASFSKVQANCGQANGSISATVSGGTATSSYQYQWFDGSNNLLIGETSASIHNIAAGIYKLRLRDDNNCEDFFSTTLGNLDGPKIKLDSLQDASCFSNSDGSIALNVSGGIAPYSYNWLPTGQSSKDISGLSAGNYTIIVKDDANCIATQTFEIKQNNLLQASFSIDSAECGECNGKAKITMTAGFAPFTYLWSNGSITDSAINLCSGMHSVKVTDSTGCSKTFNFAINNSDAPIAQISTTAASCATSCDGTAKIDVTGGTAPYRFNWMHSNSTADSLGGLCAGEYTVQVTDVKGCSQLIDFTIAAPNEIIISPELIPSKCNASPCNGSIFLNVQGGQAPYSFDWGTASAADTNYLDALCAGLYTVKVRDANACEVTKTIQLSNDGAPISSQPTISNESCYGSCDGSLISNLTASSTLSYQWLDESGTPVAAKNNDLIAKVCAGDYYLKSTKLPEGCVAFLKVKVSSSDSISLNPSIVKPISCAGECDAEVFASTIGGELPYTYSWDDQNQQQSNPALDLCSGSYQVTATDANGCSASASITLIDPQILSLTINSTTAVDCSSDCNGEASVSGQGGNPPYSFSWDGGQSTNNPNDLCFGANVVTITDATNCTYTDTVFIAAKDTVVAEVPTDSVFCEGDSISLSGEPIGTSISSFGWYASDKSLFSQSKDTTIALPVGTYTFFFTVTNGTCEDTAAYRFKVLEKPNISMAKSMKLYKDDVKKIKVDGQEQHYKYQWTPDTNLSSTEVAEPYTDTRETRFYTLRVLDSTGCTSFDSIEVIYSPRIEIASGFSPNGDGVNDQWELPALDEFPNAEVRVFNRWGKEVYTAKNGYDEPWDGTVSGEKLPIGTYYFVIDLKSDKYENITGPVTIIK